MLFSMNNNINIILKNPMTDNIIKECNISKKCYIKDLFKELLNIYDENVYVFIKDNNILDLNLKLEMLEDNIIHVVNKTSLYLIISNIDINTYIFDIINNNLQCEIKYQTNSIFNIYIYKKYILYSHIQNTIDIYNTYGIFIMSFNTIYDGRINNIIFSKDYKKALIYYKNTNLFEYNIILYDTSSLPWNITKILCENIYCKFNYPISISDDGSIAIIPHNITHLAIWNLEKLEIIKQIHLPCHITYIQISPCNNYICIVYCLIFAIYNIYDNEYIEYSNLDEQNNRTFTNTPKCLTWYKNELIIISNNAIYKISNKNYIKINFPNGKICYNQKYIYIQNNIIIVFCYNNMIKLFKLDDIMNDDWNEFYSIKNKSEFLSNVYII